MGFFGRLPLVEVTRKLKDLPHDSCLVTLMTIRAIDDLVNQSTGSL
jgi:hypothetical protein